MKKFLLEKINSTDETKFFSHDNKLCDHEIVRDLIDLTPDTSKVIYYCEKCMQDFTNVKKTN